MLNWRLDTCSPPQAQRSTSRDLGNDRAVPVFIAGSRAAGQLYPDVISGSGTNNASIALPAPGCDGIATEATGHVLACIQAPNGARTVMFFLRLDRDRSKVFVGGTRLGRRIVDDSSGEKSTTPIALNGHSEAYLVGPDAMLSGLAIGPESPSALEPPLPKASGNRTVPQPRRSPDSSSAIGYPLVLGSVATSSNGAAIITSDDRAGRIRVWDSRSGTQIASFSVGALVRQISVDDRTHIVILAGNRVTTRDASGRSLAADFDVHAQGAVLSPSGRNVVLVRNDELVLQTTRGERLGAMPRTQSRVSVAFDGDESHLAVVTSRGVAVYALHPFGPAPGAMIEGGGPIALSHKGRLIAVTSLKDSRVQLWDVAERVTLGSPLNGPVENRTSIPPAIEGMSFSSDDSRLAVITTPLNGSEKTLEAALTVYDVSPTSWRRSLCELGGKARTDGELSDRFPRLQMGC
jgi:hypothetical protein